MPVSGGIRLPGWIYIPTAERLNRRPDIDVFHDSIIAVRLKSVSVCVALTSTPAIIAPDSSLTVPLI